jgi:3-oxoacyl-[acyl-carrier-protein] synthase-1
MPDPKDDVVVTGAAVCCHLGDDLPAILAMLRDGASKPFIRWEVAERLQARCLVIGRYDGDIGDAALGIKKAQSRFMGRASRMALRCSRAALAEAGRDPADPAGMAVVFGSGTGDVETHAEVHDKLRETSDTKRVSPTVIPRLMASTVSANLVHVLRSTGPSFSATAACAGGNYNVLLAAQLVRSGHAGFALAGGVEVTDPHFFAGFDAMGAYCRDSNDRPERASRPYAADRAGFIFGEGAGAVVLERRASAIARGAKILGVLRGWGMSSDGSGEMVAPDWRGAKAALESALRDAGVSADDVGYVNTHGTSTPLGDVSEVKAMREVFRGRRVPYSSTKGYTGHTISAAGVVEAIFTMAMVDGGWIAPSVHASPLDPELADHPPVTVPTKADLRWAISSSFGFGGTNASIVVERADVAGLA